MLIDIKKLIKITRNPELISPYVIFSDLGASFAMGAIGGGVWYGIKGAKNSPRVSHPQQSGQDIPDPHPPTPCKKEKAPRSDRFIIYPYPFDLDSQENNLINN